MNSKIIVLLFSAILLSSIVSASVIIPSGKIKQLGKDKEKEFSWQEVTLSLNQDKTSGTLYVNAFADNSPVHFTAQLTQISPNVRVIDKLKTNTFTTRTYAYTGSYDKYNELMPSIQGKMRITYNKRLNTYTIQSVSPTRNTIAFNLYNVQ